MIKQVISPKLPYAHLLPDAAFYKAFDKWKKTARLPDFFWVGGDNKECISTITAHFFMEEKLTCVITVSHLYLSKIEKRITAEDVHELDIHCKSYVRSLKNEGPTYLLLTIDEAQKLLWVWTDNANKEKSINEPLWTPHCGNKVDFDGPIISVNSRFFPPRDPYGPNWDGTVTVMLLGKELEEKEFECPDLDTLKLEVETYLKKVVSRISLKDVT